MKKYALALLALLLLLPAVLASGEALDVAVPEYMRPYAPAEITVTCPDAGELTLRVSDDLDGQADLLVIGKPEQLSDCETPAIRRLPLPVNRYQLAEAAEALTQAQQARAPAKPSQQDQEIIRHAKALLQSARGMTEPEAHRYLQRRSMEAHRKMADTARLVIAALEK